MGKINRRVATRVAIAAAIAITGAIGVGVVTNAVGNNPPTTFFACATRTGQVKSATIRTGVAPKCNTKQRETLVSWNGAKAVDSIDDLVGTPCRVGNPAEGRLVITYEPGSGAAAMSCPPNNQVTLTVSRTGPGAAHNSIVGDGINCGVVCTASFPYGTVVSLSAASTDLAPFLGFSGDCTGNSCTLQMTANRTVSGAFGHVSTLPLTLDLSVGSEGGQYVRNLGFPGLESLVTSDLPGFECGPVGPIEPDDGYNSTSCATTVDSLTVVHFDVATDARGWVDWDGCDSSDERTCTVLVDAATSVVAAVRPAWYHYRSNLAGADGLPCGTVHVATAFGVDVTVQGCGQDPEASNGGPRIAFGPGDTLTIAATPNPGWSMTWMDCPTVAGNTCTATSAELLGGHRPFAVWTAPDDVEVD